jgi:MEMO1 family protein
LFPIAYYHLTPEFEDAILFVISRDLKKRNQSTIFRNIRMKTNRLLVLVLLVFTANCRSQNNQINRQPAVSGQLYPSSPNELKATLKNLFSKAVPSKKLKTVVAIISPHAGYVYSGEVAASSFNQIDAAKGYENIFVIGSSHHVVFDGASIYNKGDFLTPLGTVKVNTELAKHLIKKYSFFNDRDDAHLNEHSIEVQLPFLQYMMKKNFKILPIILGTQTPEMCKKIADALRPYFNSKNLFIISTDFSHYPSYEDAIKIDKATADAVCSNSAENLIKTLASNEEKGIANLATSLCGWTSVLTLLYMTQGSPDITIDAINYKNSGDTELGDKSKVVGYNAIVVSLKENKAVVKFNLSDKDKKDLLSIARSTIEQYLRNNTVPEIDGTSLSENLKMNCGAFVTLHKRGELRGCIGRFDAIEPLNKVVQQMAIAAATQDYRFSPVEQTEIGALEIEISVLTPMRKINSIDEVEMGRHGIYIKKDGHSGTFLPQVATETGWSKEEFLGHCAQDKASIGWNGWKDAELFVYEALVFSEKEFMKQ